MTALRTLLADMRADLNIWLDRLSNWQFVAALAGFFILCYVAYAGISDLAGSHVNLRYLIPQAVLLIFVFTGGRAWKRWK